MKSDNKQKKSLFWIIYAVVTSIAVIAGVVVLIVLWDFLAAYEKSQPKHMVNEVVEKINSRDESYVNDYVLKYVSEFEKNEEAKIENEFLSGTWTYSKKSSDYTADTPVYNLKKDGINKGVLKLKKSDERGSYNTPVWMVEDVTFTVDTKEYVISVPENAKLKVNGIEVADSYITDANAECEALVNAKAYLSKVPVMKKYTISGLMYEPQISAVGAYGGELQIIKKENAKSESGSRYTNIVFDQDNDATLIAAQKERIIAATKTYGYFANHARSLNQLAAYMMPDSYAYKYMKRIEDNNIWSSGRTEGTFENIEILNEHVYSEDCFSCEVKFTYKVKTIIKWEEFDTHVYYMFVKKDGKFYMVDFSFVEE